MALLAALALAAAAQTPPELLGRIREKMARNLSQVPNYTCLQTIERSQRASARQKLQPVDKTRLEVALVDGDELYAWPGAGRFEEHDIEKFLGGGMSARGDYALHAHAVFATRAPVFRFAGEEMIESRRAIRFDYDVALRSTDYLVRSGDTEAAVPYHGSFWADPVALDLIRLDIIADSIPAELEIARAVTEIRYSKIKVGQSDFLLPSRVDLLLERADGTERRNQTGFAGCHQYVGESTISFDEPGAGPAPRGEIAQIELPAGLGFDLRLKEAVNLRSAAVGDPVIGALPFPAKKDGKIILPKGATIHGRLRQLTRDGDYTAVGIELFEARFEGARAALLCRLEQVGPLQGGTSRALAVIPETQLGIGAFMIQTARFPALPAGLRMVWITQATVK